MDAHAMRTEIDKLNPQQRAKLRRVFPGDRAISYIRVDDDFDRGARAVEFQFEGNQMTRYVFLGPRGGIITMIDPYAVTSVRQ
jgi:hypothetical protein